ncbi:SgcJ/EcaC family oxidoreductase [Tunturibacter psychrotolerans]|uniref:SgcJ/EcaC family oxidoreductase n=1 Tax=Tunturiibacter psychrotolerans TaxID=3069686 RepID=A0AAU7ZS99_9BACT
MNLKWIRSAAIGLVLSTLFMVRCEADAQSKADESSVRNVPRAFAAAWAKHDGTQLSKIMSEDVDFVNVSGEWLRGRSDFALFHSRLLSGRFKDSTVTPLTTSVRFLRPDLAVLHWSWRIDGDKNLDLTSRKTRFGLFTMIVEKKDGTWLVTAAQNTNHVPPPNPDPEMEGIKLGILFPTEQ